MQLQELKLEVINPLNKMGELTKHTVLKGKNGDQIPIRSAVPGDPRFSSGLPGLYLHTGGTHKLTQAQGFF